MITEHTISNLKEFILQDVLLNESGIYSNDNLEKLSYVKREKVDIPVITVSRNSSSVVTGTGNLTSFIRNYLKEREVKAKVIEVGSIGICSLETFVSVQLPGKTKLLYKKVGEDNIIAILDGNFNNYIAEENVFGQFRNKMHEPYENIPFIDEISYFSHQQRSRT